jgi:hypothetical protein
MSRTSLAGAFALLAAPVVVAAGTLVQPTISDDPAAQVAALTDHRGAMIAGMTLTTLALALLIYGTIWLALAVAPRAPGLALAGGVLGMAGWLILLFEAGIAAAAPAVVHGLDPAAAAAALDRIGSSTAVTALEPLSLVGDVGIALLGFAATRSGAPRWSAAAIAVGAFAETAGFATETRALVIAGFAVMLVGLARAVRSLVAEPRSRVAARAVPAA